MKSVDKIKYINELVEKLNKKVLANKNWHLEFDNNRGANNYCILIKKEDKEIWCASFGTYDNVINCLDLIKNMFSMAINEKRGK